MSDIVHLVLLGVGETEARVVAAIEQAGLDASPCHVRLGGLAAPTVAAALAGLTCPRDGAHAHGAPDGVVLHGELDRTAPELATLLDALRRRWPGVPLVAVHAPEARADPQLVALGVDDVVPAQAMHIRAALLLHSRTSLERRVRAEAEEATRSSRERFQRIFDELDEGILLVDAEARVLFANHAGRVLLDLAAREDDLRGVDFADEDGIYIGYDATPVATVVRAGGTARSVLVVRSEAQEERYLDVRARALPPSEEGGTALVVLSDVTQARRAEARSAELERQLHHTQRLHTLGQMAGGIAHDFNNILAPLQGYLDLVRERVGHDAVARSDLGHIGQAVHRAQDLIRQIATFGGHGEVQRRRVDVHAIATEALGLLRASLPSTIEIRQHRGIGPVTVHADPTQIHQVVMNLCTNAGRAMPGGGRLSVSVDAATCEGPLPGQGDDVPPGDYVRLRVEDTGCGMGQGTLERIFEPFFTTRLGGEGSGLGLSVVHGVVHQHGGAIRVRTAVGRGTTFDVYLPQGAAGADPEAGEDIGSLLGTERLLMVDDEPSILDVLARTLERMGYEVDTALTSPHALAKVRSAPDAYDVLITDYTMPRMTGLVLAREARQIQPALRVVLMTGFAGRMEPGALTAAGVDRLLLKPLDAHRVAQTVRELMPRAPEQAGTPAADRSRT